MALSITITMENHHRAMGRLIKNFASDYFAFISAAYGLG